MKASAAVAALALAGCVLVRLPPEAIHGRVSDESGRPVAGATVQLRERLANPWTPTQLLQLTRTRDDGTFSFAARADAQVGLIGDRHRYTVLVEHPGHFLKLAAVPEPLSQAVELVIGPRLGDEDPKQLCRYRCIDLYEHDCRRVAEFHFGDKTRCDAYHVR